jgi:hypothetical protein
MDMAEQNQYSAMEWQEKAKRDLPQRHRAQRKERKKERKKSSVQV